MQWPFDHKMTLTTISIGVLTPLTPVCLVCESFDQCGAKVDLLSFQKSLTHCSSLELSSSRSSEQPLTAPVTLVLLNIHRCRAAADLPNISRSLAPSSIFRPFSGQPVVISRTFAGHDVARLAQGLLLVASKEPS
jgi:hypothetical protein